jgi:hypothetical protein
MGFNDLIVIEPAPISALDRGDEIESLARDRIAERLQTRLRSTLDPGVDLRAAVQTQTLRVVPDGERFVARQEDQGKVLLPATQSGSSGDDDPNDVTNVEQLFQMSSGVPSVVDGRLVYRTISPSVLFGNHREAAQAQVIEQTVTATLRDEVVDAYEEAIADVSRQHVGDR